jgi:hypothetical protein
MQHFTLWEAAELTHLWDTLGRMTAGGLTLGVCRKLRTLPASIMHLSRLQKLLISGVLEDSVWHAVHRGPHGWVRRRACRGWTCRCWWCLRMRCWAGGACARSGGKSSFARAGELREAAVCFKDLEEA